MKKIKGWLFVGCIVVFTALGWLAYPRGAEDAYEGMSIIPEQHKDIPVYDGLKPANHDYRIEGNRWKEIYDFYVQQLPGLGWQMEYGESTAEGFYSRWRKEGFDGELWIWANYNRIEDRTEVVFDKLPLYHSTAWIDHAPSSICIYPSAGEGSCEEIKDPTRIEGIVNLINHAMDWNEERLPRDKASAIDFGRCTVQVLYGGDKEIYFVSEKGTKLMKPEREFFELAHLPR